MTLEGWKEECFLNCCTLVAALGVRGMVLEDRGSLSWGIPGRKLWKRELHSFPGHLCVLALCVSLWCHPQEQPGLQEAAGCKSRAPGIWRDSRLCGACIGARRVCNCLVEVESKEAFKRYREERPVFSSGHRRKLQRPIVIGAKETLMK